MYRESVTCKVFLGFTLNLISSGVRDTIFVGSPNLSRRQQEQEQEQEQEFYY